MKRILTSKECKSRRDHIKTSWMVNDERTPAGHQRITFFSIENTWVQQIYTPGITLKFITKYLNISTPFILIKF